MINEKHVFKSGGGSDRSSQLPLCPAAGVVEGLHAKFEIKKKSQWKPQAITKSSPRHATESENNPPGRRAVSIRVQRERILRSTPSRPLILAFPHPTFLPEREQEMEHVLPS
jgi:hypothetical protein